MTRTRTSSDLELLVALDRDGAEPLHRQLEANLRSGIRDGRLAAGTVLPSTRALAAQLGVSRGIVVEAYEQLVAEGFLDSGPAARPGSPAARRARPCPRGPRDRPPGVRLPSRPTRRDGVPRAAWLRSIRRVLAEAPADRFSYLGGRGMPELRIALAGVSQPGSRDGCSARDRRRSTGFMQGSD